MPEIKHTFFFTVLFLIVLPVFFFAAPPKNQKKLFTLDLAPTFGFYTINKNHAIDPVTRPGASLGFKKEMRVGNAFKTSVLIGVDYFFHGLTFKSYYFKPDTLQIYDKSFAYSYSLFIHEIDIPIQFKYLFKQENNSLFSPYIAIAYHLRFLLPGSLKVREDDKVVRNDGLDLKFKNYLFFNKMNAFVSASIGWQKSSIGASAKRSFFAELNFKYGFSPYYFQTDYSASSLYINAVHLSVVLGLKF